MCNHLTRELASLHSTAQLRTAHLSPVVRAQCFYYIKLVLSQKHHVDYIFYKYCIHNYLDNNVNYQMTDKF